MKTDTMEQVTQVFTLEQVAQYFMKGFHVKKGQEIISYEAHATTDRKVIFIINVNNRIREGRHEK